MNRNCIPVQEERGWTLETFEIMYKKASEKALSENAAEMIYSGSDELEVIFESISNRQALERIFMAGVSFGIGVMKNEE